MLFCPFIHFSQPASTPGRQQQLRKEFLGFGEEWRLQLCLSLGWVTLGKLFPLTETSFSCLQNGNHKNTWQRRVGRSQGTMTREWLVSEPWREKWRQWTGRGGRQAASPADTPPPPPRPASGSHRRGEVCGLQGNCWVSRPQPDPI